MNPLLEVDAIYVINLASRADRRAEIQVQLERVGLSLTKAPVRLFAACRPESAGGFDSIGAHGCFRSHLGVLEDAVASGAQRILIFEDDLDFSEAGLPAIQAAFAALGGHDWGMFYGGHRMVQPVTGAGPVIALASNEIVSTAHFIGFQAPWIGVAADYLAAMLARPPGDPLGGPMHVDGAYTWLRAAHPTLQTWAAMPALGEQRSSRTDIHALPWFDAIPGVRSLAHLARRWRRGR